MTWSFHSIHSRAAEVAFKKRRPIHSGFHFLGSGFRASDWISWISLFSFGLYKGGFRSRRWIS